MLCASVLLLPGSSSYVVLTELSSLPRPCLLSPFPSLLLLFSPNRASTHSKDCSHSYTSLKTGGPDLRESCTGGLGFVSRPPPLGAKGQRRRQNATAFAQGRRERRRETWTLQERAAISHQREKRKGIGQTAGGPSKLTQPKSALNLIRDENERQ